VCRRRVSDRPRRGRDGDHTRDRVPHVSASPSPVRVAGASHVGTSVPSSTAASVIGGGWGHQSYRVDVI
jgi:hypothetical protein